MAVDMTAVHRLAGELCAYETQLMQAKSRLRAYQESVGAGWQGEEVAGITRAIEQALARISAAENQLAPLAQDIRQAAEEVRREEEAAAAQARRQAQIRQVREELEKAKEARDELLMKRNGAAAASGRFNGPAGPSGSPDDDPAAAAVLRVEELERLLEALLR